MDMESIKTAAESFIFVKYFDAGYLGFFSGQLNYFFYLMKSESIFKIRDVVICGSIGSLVSIIVYIVLPEGPNKLAWVIACGFFSFKIVDFVDTHINKFLKMWAKKSMDG